MDALPPDVRAALASDLTIDITTIGRHSGEPRRIEIWFLHIDGRIWITGTPGRRDWFANMLAEPSFVFHLKESVVADLPALARREDDPVVRRAVFEHDVAHWYRGQCSLDELIADAPLVEVTFPS